MSVEVAVHSSSRSFGRRSIPHSRLERAAPVERPLARLLTFSALGLYGVLRWATLMRPAPGLRLAGLLVLAVLVAGAGAKLDRHSRALSILLATLALIAALLVAGVPPAWLLHVRLAVVWQGIGQGISALPGVLVPYIGIDPWVQLVIVLGAGVLLLDAALMLTFSTHTLGDLRRAAAALPLITLAVVPSTLAHPQLPYAQGLLLFALIAAFMWSERTIRHHAAGAVLLAAAAGLCAIVLAPRFDQHRPWLNYQALAGSLSPTHVETFDWTQRYGALNWPHVGREVLDVKAPHPDYWKAENLDLFDGVSWTAGPGILGSQLPPPSTAAQKRFTQTVQVTIRAMRTPQVITAGFAYSPAHIGEGAVPGVSPGTWIAGAPLGPGDSYAVVSYSPRPAAAELAAAGDGYPVGAVADELAVQLPSRSFSLTRPEVEFPPFHSGLSITNVVGAYAQSGVQLLQSSPYAAAYRLASRLASAASTPYAFVRSVARYLSASNGFRYVQNPAASVYPLETFLFSTKRGYCQQFAGAMALLLRMGGVPARVSTGFTTGAYDRTTHQYVVSDLDAHAWVEAWFPNWGWVRFDPTPPQPPTQGAGVSLLPNGGLGNNARLPRAGTGGAHSAAVGNAPSEAHSGLSLWLVLALPTALLLIVAAAFSVLRRATPASVEQLVAELERAHARCGRPLAAAATLHALEQRLRSAPEAEEYVRTLRLSRFRAAEDHPSVIRRRALRRQLALGLGVTGWLRAWWGLPPRPGFGRPVGPEGS